MSKCCFPLCKKEHTCSKQFNDLVIRCYLCTDHLIAVAHLDSYNHGPQFIEMLRNSKNANK